MATNPVIPAPATNPVSPPIKNLPIVDSLGFPSPTFLQAWQELWSAVSGQGGVSDQIITGIVAPAPAVAQSLITQASDKAAPISNLLGRLARMEQQLASLRILTAPPVAFRGESPSPISWTPVVAGSTTSGVQTYTTQSGVYCEIGPCELALFSIQLATVDAGIAGNVMITGLPIASNASGAAQGGWLSEWGNSTLGAGYTSLGVTLAAGVAQFGVIQAGSAKAPLALPASALSGTDVFIGGALYFR
jgi:hypothetical protein